MMNTSLILEVKKTSLTAHERKSFLGLKWEGILYQNISFSVSFPSFTLLHISHLLSLSPILGFLFFRCVIQFTLSSSYLFIQGLHCCAQVFSSCGESGLLFLTVCELHISVTSLPEEHRP